MRQVRTGAIIDAAWFGLVGVSVFFSWNEAEGEEGMRAGGKGVATYVGIKIETLIIDQSGSEMHHLSEDEDTP